MKSLKAPANPRVFLTGVILLHCFYLGFQLVNQNYFLSDSVEYLQAAKNWMTHGTWYAGDWSEPINSALFTKRPPGYPLFLMLFHSTGEMPLVLLIQNLMGITSLWLARRMFIKLGYDTHYDYLFLLVLVLFPAHFIYANLLMSESLLQFLIVLLGWALFRYFSKPKWKWMLIAQTVLAAALLVKPVIYLWLVVSSIFLLVVFWRKKKLRHAWTFLIPLFVIGFISVRNHKFTDSYSFSSIQQINLTYYNAYYFTVSQEGYESATAEIDSISSVANEYPYPEKWDVLTNWAVSEITKAPFSYTVFHLRGMLSFFVDPGRFDLYNFFGIQDKNEVGLLRHFSENGLKGVLEYAKQLNPVIIVFLLMITLARTAIFIGMLLFFSKLPKTPVMWYLGLLIAFMAFATGPLGASRFAVPVAPLIILLALSFASIRRQKDLALKSNAVNLRIPVKR